VPIGFHDLRPDRRPDSGNADRQRSPRRRQRRCRAPLAVLGVGCTVGFSLPRRRQTSPTGVIPPLGAGWRSRANNRASASATGARAGPGPYCSAGGTRRFDAVQRPSRVPHRHQRMLGRTPHWLAATEPLQAEEFGSHSGRAEKLGAPEFLRRSLPTCAQASPDVRRRRDAERVGMRRTGERLECARRASAGRRRCL